MRYFLLFTFVLMLIVACSSTEEQEFVTNVLVTQNILSATPLSPTISSTNIKATITPPPPRNPIVDLPNGLKIEEYAISPESNFGEVLERHESNYGNLYPRMIHAQPSVFLLENSVTVTSTTVDEKKWAVVVNVKGENVYETTVSNLSGVSGLIQAWSYEDHWAIEVRPYPPDGSSDVIVDGQSIRSTYNYKEVFGFQLLDGKPFYFFRNDEGVGISYNYENSTPLYENVLYRNFWIGYDADPVQYENMVMFHATLHNEDYLVLIGLLND